MICGVGTDGCVIFLIFGTLYIKIAKMVLYIQKILIGFKNNSIIVSSEKIVNGDAF